MTLQTVINILLVVLILGGIAVGYKLYIVLGDVHKLLGNVKETLDKTQKDIEGTVTRVHTLTDRTQKLMDEEIEPTLRLVKANLAHIEVTTRAVADTTVAARQIAHRGGDALGDISRTSPVGKLLTDLALKHSATLATSLISGLGGKVMAMIGQRLRPKPKTIDVKSSEQLVPTTRSKKNGHSRTRSDEPTLVPPKEKKG